MDKKYQPRGSFQEHWDDERNSRTATPLKAPQTPLERGLETLIALIAGNDPSRQHGHHSASPTRGFRIVPHDAVPPMPPTPYPPHGQWRWESNPGPYGHRDDNMIANRRSALSSGILPRLANGRTPEPPTSHGGAKSSGNHSLAHHQHIKPNGELLHARKHETAASNQVPPLSKHHAASLTGNATRSHGVTFPISPVAMQARGAVSHSRYFGKASPKASTPTTPHPGKPSGHIAPYKGPSLAEKLWEGSPHDAGDQVSDFTAGVGDSATMGASTWASDKIAHAGWHEKAYLNPNSAAFKGGVVIETGGELLAGGLPGAMKHMAEKAIEKEAERIVLKRGEKVITDDIRREAKDRLERQARSKAVKHYPNIQKTVKDASKKVVRHADQVHHEIPLLGHHGGIPSLTPSLGLPTAIRDSRLFTRVVKTTEAAVKDGKLIPGSSSHAGNALLHHGLRKQEEAFRLYKNYVIPAHIVRNIWKLGTDEGSKK